MYLTDKLNIPRQYQNMIIDNNKNQMREIHSSWEKLKKVVKFKREREVSQS